ncbi:hypothetical protein SAMN05428967_4486 [Phyllobacterium sp. YR620]|uniref:hypothetical protein n=1 Tax=Phyllobacterium sp. YR620 TaxID=1881066 RepID=UPI000883AFF8|nr:hypothetical protein [Phyllobacterium sp. YR620]SDP92609.1 hypothetical protein SAMN05428967_4486 [Phyllobacterium sp. YR620]
MFRNLALNRVMLGIVFCTLVFFVLRSVFPPVQFIIFLNGIFAGSIVAILVAYHKLIWYAVLGVGEYNRVRQMTIGFAICWVAICVGASNSIYLRSTGAEIPMTDLTAAARYLSIIAAMLQVTAPDFGLGLFHGRDRRVLWLGVSIGLTVATITMIVQQWGT